MLCWTLQSRSSGQNCWQGAAKQLWQSVRQRTPKARRHVQTNKNVEGLFYKQSICSTLAGAAMETEARTTKDDKQRQKQFQHELQMHPQQCGITSSGSQVPHLRNWESH